MRKINFFSMLLISCLSVVSLFANSGDADIGAKLFQGTTHFKNGGVACIACHTVNSELVEDGGKLAMDLTTMGGAGVQYSIENPQNASSAVMKNAFKGKPLTTDEQANLVAFFD
jgi:mono/diheme cytochrome c family protein